MAAAADTPPPAAAPAAAPREPNHGLRIFIPWLVISVAADLLIWIVWGPHLPPGRMSSSANGQQFDIKVMAVMAAPVMAFVLTYFGYALIVWRHREGDEEDGPPLHGHTRIQATWITITTVIVLFLAAFGTFELVTTGPAGANGAGGGEGASPIWTPGGHPLQVQVIAQQWAFTYRYPQYGGFETTQLVLPEGQWIQFNVTSLDVIHDFWAYQLGVKADANPGVNNVAFTKPTQTGAFIVRCDELCGLWHGAMYNSGRVVTLSQFQGWAAHTRVQLAAITRLLPPYALTYDPTVVPKLGAVLVKLGLTGGGGGFYNPADPVQP